MLRVRVASQEKWWLPLAIGVIAIAIGIIIAVVIPADSLFRPTTILVASISLMGLGVVTGTAGMIALCQLSFAAVGAWIVEWLSVNDVWGNIFGNFSFVLYMLIAGVGTAAIGVVVGLPALRLRGVNLAVITLGIAAAFDLTLQKTSFPALVAGKHIARPFDLGPGFGGDRGIFIFAVVVTAAVAIGVTYLQHSRWGSSWKSVAFSERGTASAGTSVQVAKLTAFGVSAFIGGIAGGLFDSQITQANFSSFSPLQSLGMYVLSAVVGSHLIDMALLGGVLFVVIPWILQLLKVPLEWSTVIFGVFGIQALTTGSNLGADIRNGLRRRRGKAAPDLEAGLVANAEIIAVEIPRGTGKVLLDVKGLTVEFGAVKALTNVNLVLEEGTILGLIGPNGAGKSTFVDALTGFLPDHGGSVTLDGVKLDSLAPNRIARGGLRRTYQQDRVPPTLSVGAYMRFVSRGQAKPEEIAEILEFFACPPTNIPLSLVDVGTKRLIEVAASVAAKPKVLLLDEPAAGLSHDEHIAFGDRLRQVPSRYGVTILLIEHDLDLVRSVSTSITVLNFGEVLATGSQESVLSNPEVLKAYMGETELL
ncbi:MAG: branched-chain amino acid ABC transporter ATP-binding protein/permease [Actinomycetales bacterium]|nr:branched-chain amino acid ABC transporter ATP-binding protein/permease [Actinomycetales bacterium]